MHYESSDNELVRQADDSPLHVIVKIMYTLDEGEAKYLQAIADAYGRQPEEVLGRLLKFDSDNEPCLSGWDLCDDLITINKYTAAAMVMSAALAMFIFEPHPADPLPFHDPQPKEGRMLMGELPEDKWSWGRAAERWRAHLRSGEAGGHSGGSERAIKAFDKALDAALALDGKTCREHVIKAAEEAGYLCDCCERLIRQGLRYYGIYTCCHECANCQSLEHSPCCHGMCDQPTATQFNTLSAVMLVSLIEHAEQKSLDIHQLTAAMAMAVDYEEVTAEQRDKAKRELFSAIHKLRVRLDKQRGAQARFS